MKHYRPFLFDLLKNRKYIDCFSLNDRRSDEVTGEKVYDVSNQCSTELYKEIPLSTKSSLANTFRGKEPELLGSSPTENAQATTHLRQSISFSIRR
jgi:hypothetical protein